MAAAANNLFPRLMCNMYFIGDEEIEALKKLFSRKKFYRYQSSYQSECDLFEQEFSQHFSTSHSLLLSSGTNALLLSLLASGIQPGDEVLIPTYTFVATAAAVVQAGAIPVLVNIDHNLSLDVQDAQTKISEKTKALILVHMDGLVANVKGCQDFCQKNSLTFIEDVAQAIGGSFEDKRLGTFGSFGCYSLNENKNISCGEGGILITRDRASYEKAFCLHDGPAQFNPTKKEFFKETTPILGFSMRVSEIQGAIMRVQLKRLDFILSELRQRKMLLTEYLNSVPGIRYVKGHSQTGDCASSLHLQFDDPEKGAAIGRKLREAGYLFAPVTTRPAHASWKWSHLLGTKSHIQDDVNPFLRAEKTYQYPIAQYLDSVEILSKTIKMDIDIHQTPEQAKSMGENIRQVLTHG